MSCPYTHSPINPPFLFPHHQTENCVISECLAAPAAPATGTTKKGGKAALRH